MIERRLETKTTFAGEENRYQMDFAWDTANDDGYCELVIWDRMNYVTSRGVPMMQAFGIENVEALRSLLENAVTTAQSGTPSEDK
jgi:hypothetical protein